MSEARQSEEKIARSAVPPRDPRPGPSWLTRTFHVAEEVVERCQDWSDPVRFKFERLPDGQVELWLKTENGHG